MSEFVEILDEEQLNERIAILKKKKPTREPATPAEVQDYPVWTWRFSQEDWYPRFNYSSDISAAWTLWEEMYLDREGKAAEHLGDHLGLSENYNMALSTIVQQVLDRLTPFVIAQAYYVWKTTEVTTNV